MKPTCQSLVLLAQLGLVGVLFGAVAPPAEPTGPSKDTATVNDKRFHERLLNIARIYSVYGRVDDEARWAPTLCRTPSPAQAHYSRSTDETTHGQKLYSLFARDRAAYVESRTPGAVGQVIVKESWVPLEIEGKPKNARLSAPKDRKAKPIEVPTDLGPIGKLALAERRDVFHPFAEHAGKWYKADRRGDLFIMMKLDPRTAGADAGWVYGTVSADGKTVTSAGRVASCMKCHETRSTRLFGLERDEKKVPKAQIESRNR